MPMQTKRFPLTATLAPRSALTTKDGLLRNCYHETTPIGDMLIKRPGLRTTWNAGIGCAEGAITYNGKALIIVGGQYGTTTQAPAVFSPGTSWTSYAAQTHPGSGLTIAQARPPMLGSLGGNLYYIGLGGSGATNPPNVYKSADNGTSWTTLISSPPWTISSLTGFPVIATLGSTLFIVLNDGGGNSAVWGTPDGSTWTLRAASIVAGVLPQALVAHSDSKLYAFFDTSVYSSPDGATWSLVTGAPGWTGRSGFGAWSLGANLFVGGGTTGVEKNDVWKSTDNGATWTQIVVTAAFSARDSFAYWSYNSKLWLGAGKTNGTGTTCESDLWSSSDGITWISINASFAGLAFSRMSFCNHNGTMYVCNGFNTTPRTANVSFFAAGASTPATGAVVMTPFVPAVATCEPFSLTLIPASGVIPVKVFLKTSLYAWVYDGTTMTQVTDSDYPALTVPGVVYLDGTIYVMNSQGVIFGSNLNDPTSWSALNFLSANSEADAAVVLARQLNYVVAFKQTSTEFFYDAANPTGSPLGKVLNALLEIGCGHAQSLAFADNTIYFIANSRQKGRSIMKLEGYTPKVISNPYIDRILNGDSLATVYAFVVKSNGHFFYVLTLVASAITLVYDEASAEWHTWTTLTINSPASANSATVQSDGSILLTMAAAHGQEDGNRVVIAGASPAATNGTFYLRYDTTTMTTAQFSYYPATTVSGTITGTITATFYTESFFPGVYYSYGDGVDYLVDRTTGIVYTFDPFTYGDNSAPINVLSRSAILDFGVIADKRYSRLELLGDQELTTVLVRYSDDDYQTNSFYRPIPLSQKRPMLSNLGSARRRSFTFRNIDQTALRLLAAEVDIDIGSF